MEKDCSGRCFRHISPSNFAWKPFDRILVRSRRRETGCLAQRLCPVILLLCFGSSCSALLSYVKNMERLILSGSWPSASWHAPGHEKSLPPGAVVLNKPGLHRGNRNRVAPVRRHLQDAAVLCQVKQLPGSCLAMFTGQG